MMSLRQILRELAQLPTSLADGSRALDQNEVQASRVLYPNGHLPDTFDPSQGLRSLFPSASAIRLSWLAKYLYSIDGVSATQNLSAHFNVRADGAGNWCLRVLIETVGEGRCGSGFVFMFSADGAGHGLVSTGDYGDGDSGSDEGVGVSILAHGFDPWIQNNWPNIFVESSFLYLSAATGFDKLPPIANAATDNGFSGLTALQGPKSGDFLSPIIVVFGFPYISSEHQSFDLLWGLDIQNP